MFNPQRTSIVTEDTSLEDEYEIIRLDALPPDLRDLAVLHVIDQFESVPSYGERFSEQHRP
ncbi:MAG: hypothetical protein H0V70_01575 [Ktedonobacteraceae bacterium]|nr:hypothetical protein [Ktedonobacteraceae bacterium]